MQLFDIEESQVFYGIYITLSYIYDAFHIAGII